MSNDESLDDGEKHPAPQNDANDDDILTDTDEYYLPPPPRRRRPLAIIAVIVLIIVLVGGGLAIARAVGGGAIGAAPTPTATLLPGENLFYITTDPSWGTVSVDGHTLARLPTLGDQPLMLAAGGHTIVWNASPLPPQKCLVFVPPQQTSGGNCSATDQMTVRSGKDAGLQATVVEFTLDSSMLSHAQFTALSNAIQSYFNTLQSTDTVQPGEQYASASAPNNVVTATQPLKAAFNLRLDTNSNSSLPCYVGNVGLQSCSSCYTFCSPSFGLDFNALPKNFSYPPTWDIYVVADANWNYTTLSGQSIAANQPDTAASTSMEYVTALFITWTGSQWHVSDIPAKNDTSFFFGFTPPCSVAQADLLNNNSLSNPYFSVTLNGQAQTLSWQEFDSGNNLAQGCLAGAIIQPSNYKTPVTSSTPEAFILYRFGVLLAANSLAHRWWPNLPVANAYEQDIVQQLLPKHK